MGTCGLTRRLKAKIEEKRTEVEKVKALIPGYKAKVVTLLRSMAKQDYLSDPSSIFDIPQNQDFRQLQNEFNFGTHS